MKKNGNKDYHCPNDHAQKFIGAKPSDQKSQDPKKRMDRERDFSNSLNHEFYSLF